MSERMFPVLRSHDDDGCPHSVPWSLVAPHEAQARANHYQTLERLAERGGLCPSEMVAVLEDRQWRSMRSEEAVKRLLELVREHARSERDSEDLKRLERIRKSELIDWLLIELDATKYLEEPAVHPLLDELIALLQPSEVDRG